MKLSAAIQQFRKMKTEHGDVECPIDPHALSAMEGGGRLFSYRFRNIKADIQRYAPGCGAPTHVVGTNGGTMPCGALLTQFGQTAPYFCAACYESLNPEP